MILAIDSVDLRTSRLLWLTPILDKGNRNKGDQISRGEVLVLDIVCR